MSYHLPPPTTDREFVILVLTADVSPPDGPRKMQVVTVPTEHQDAPARKGFVRGRYACVEEVEELEGGGLEWRWVWRLAGSEHGCERLIMVGPVSAYIYFVRMATVSNPGGLVPQWITDLAM